MNALAPHLTTLLPKLWRFAVRLTRHHEDAQDLVQRACVRALERQHQWRADSSPLSWLYAIVHSIWLNELDSRRLRRVTSLNHNDDEEIDVVDDAAADPETALFYRQVVTAVNALPEAQRVVMLLVAIEGLSYREASDVLEVPIGTVMSRLSRARLTIGQRFASPLSMEKKSVA
jgi:RNA polymerase sigma-70 factor (ECF subfamily)